MESSGGVVIVGGPAFTYWLTPTDEELFQKYNPELQKRSLEGRYERQKEFDDFVVNLKRLSKSDKPSTPSHLESLFPQLTLHLIVWLVQKEEEEKAREAREIEVARARAEKIHAMSADSVKMRENMRKEAGLSSSK